MVVMAFFIARYFGQSWDINAVDTKREQRVFSVQKSVQKQLSNDIHIERAMRRAGARGYWSLMAINSKTNDIILAFPPPLLAQRNRFLSLKDSEIPLLIKTRNMEFVGPLLVTSKGQEYQLFIGRLLRRDQRSDVAFAIAFVVFLITGTIACIAISWTIAKPIKELSKLSKDFAQGLLNEPSANKNSALKQRKDELGQLHNDIYDMASNLAKSLAQQKALMANISHELRTPLTRLQLALAMLQPQGDEQTRYATRIEKDIMVMDTLIGQALQLAKMNDENHAQWLQMESVSLHALLIPILDDLSFEAKASEISLQVNDTTQQTLIVDLIKTSFISAVENVTRNAIKYSSKKVLVSIEILEQPASNKASMLRICIEDDGNGLSEAQLKHVFEPFYRAPSGTHYQGTGLGLAIAKASVELHNGQISAQASDLGGLRLTLLFPIQQESSD